MKILKEKLTRFDARLPKEQKLYFEKAALLGGYRTLTDFILVTLQEKAKKIINEKEQILASQSDCEIFFDAILNSNAPNKNLRQATQTYKDLLKK